MCMYLAIVNAPYSRILEILLLYSIAANKHTNLTQFHPFYITRYLPPPLLKFRRLSQ